MNALKYAMLGMTTAAAMIMMPSFATAQDIIVIDKEWVCYYDKVTL